MTERRSLFAALAAAAVILAGALLLLSRLGAQSLWGDEAFTLVPVTTAHGVPDLFHQVRVLDTQPPGAHLVIYALRPLLPADESGWRFPSLLEGALAAGLIAALAYRLAGPLASVVAAAASIASPFLAFYAMEARNYALWLLVSLVAVFALLQWADRLRDPDGAGRMWMWAAIWAVANAAGLLTHVFHVFAVVMQGVLAAGLVARDRPPRRLWRPALVSGALGLLGGFVLLVPWLLRFWQSLPVARGVGWTRPLHPVALLYYPFAFVFGFSYGPDLRELHDASVGELLRAHPLALLSSALGLLLLAASLAALLWRRGPGRAAAAPPLPALVLLAPVLGVLGPLVYTVMRDFPLVPRHLIFVWPIVPLLEGVAFVRQKRLRPALLALFLLQAVALANLLFDPAYGKDDERAAVRHAEEASGARAYVLGDAAPLYTRHTTGLIKARVDPARTDLFDPGATDLWLVDNRPWEDPHGRYRAKLDQAAARLGLGPGTVDGRYAGIILWHWSRARAVP
jgi:hypothetical protein